MPSHSLSIAVIGGGPAGLRAAEVALVNGAKITIYDQKPSVGRKLLVAGKSGLNLTNDANFEIFCERYSGTNFPVERWKRYLAAFDKAALRQWAAGLEVETFVAAGGKVFPNSKKAAPLLRRWVARLKRSGAIFETHHTLRNIQSKADEVELDFSARGEMRRARHDAVVLAMGGASWPQTGSDGSWVSTLESNDIKVIPLRPSNCGWECNWEATTLSRAEGQPLHHLELKVGGATARGELMVTKYGFEGSPIYQLGPALHSMPNPILKIDFKPVFSHSHLLAKMESARRDFYQEARLRWKLTDAMCAILQQMYGDFDNADDLAVATKCCRIRMTGPRPIAEAISTSGGVAWQELDESLMLKKMPGVYCAGEMIDWDAPTGGFLIQGCFATGTVAGQAASLKRSTAK